MVKRPIQILQCPHLRDFEQHCVNVRTPIVLANTIEHWPAMKRWKDPRYWIRKTHGGRRLIPVELGKTYVDDGWGQQIITIGDHMKDHLLKDMTISSDKEERPVGYLAQHDLLTQVPALRKDISVPDYCYVDIPRTSAKDETPGSDEDDARAVSPTPSLPCDPMLNMWLGPGGTVSPAHTDPHHNILAQVCGRKYIRLFGKAIPNGWFWHE